MRLTACVLHVSRWAAADVTFSWRCMQIGKLLGAKVVAVARGPEKCALLSQLGADLVVDSVPYVPNPLDLSFVLAPASPGSMCGRFCKHLHEPSMQRYSHTAASHDVQGAVSKPLRQRIKSVAPQGASCCWRCPVPSGCAGMAFVALSPLHATCGAHKKPVLLQGWMSCWTQSAALALSRR
jgi:hypothetical protein